MRKAIFPIAIFLLLVNITLLADSKQFVHPGCSHKKSDLERLKAMVQAKIDPWYSSFLTLSKESNAQYTYSVKGSKSFTTVTQDGLNYSALSADVKAAYLNAIMWAATGDVRHADKAVEILNAWQNLTCFTGGGTESLNAGRVAWQLIEAAEIIKSTYSGWLPADIQKFKDMLVYPGYSNTGVPSTLNSNNGTFYWRVYQGDCARHGNQDLFGWRVVMSMGIFLDNEIMYDRALSYFTGLTHRPDDLPYVSGPPINSNSPTSSSDYFLVYSRNGEQNAIPDYGYDGVLTNYIWENGQCQESSRDQDHAILGLGLISSLAEMAWNQGSDVYSMFDNRILKGYEWALRYNVSNNYSFPDQPSSWEPTAESGEFIQRRDRTGRWYSLKVNPHYEGDFVGFSRGNFRADKRPVYEVALAHYDVRMGLTPDLMKWTKRALDISNQEVGYETSGWSLDHLGWGGLTFHRSAWMTGDPVHFENGKPVFEMPEIPYTINAVNYDYFTADGQNRTYYDATPNNSGAVYRTDAVDITAGDNGYVVNDMQNGEWLSYTFKVAVEGEYHIVLRHNTNSTGAQMKVSIDNEMQLESAFPVTNGYEETSFGGVQLTKGAKVIRIYVTGVSNVTSLSRIKIILNPNAIKKINFSSTLNASNQAVLNWSFENIIPTNLRILRGTTKDIGNAVTIKTLSNDMITYTDATVNAKTPSYYYWVVCDEAGTQRTSDVSSVSWGFFFDNFMNPSTALWSVVNGTGSVSGSVLNVNTYSSSKAYLSRTGGVTLHAGNYPILAYKMDSPSGTSTAIHSAVSSILGGGNNMQTGVLNNNVYYYNLHSLGFVSSSGTKMVPVDSIFSSTFFQIRMAVTSSNSSQLSWVGTFKSVSDLSQFIFSDVKSLTESGISFSQRGNKIVLNSLNGRFQLRVFNIAGQLISQKIITSSDGEILFPCNGMYIVSLKGKNVNLSQKIIVN